MDEFVKQIVQYPVKIAWIGSGCSLATEPTAEISQHYNITQVQPFVPYMYLYSSVCTVAVCTNGPDRYRSEGGNVRF